MVDFLSTFIAFFAVIDPVGTVPVYIAVTAAMAEEDKRKVAIEAVAVSALILIFFVLAGEVILSALGVPLAAFEITGGIVLFIFALTMIFGESKPDEEIKMGAAKSHVAIFPLAVPSIASPGAMMAAVMLTENSTISVIGQLQVVSMLLAVLVVVLILTLSASYVHRLIGDSGAVIISRVMGLILASVAMTSILAGIRVYFEL